MTASCSLLVVVHLARSNSFSDLQGMQGELAGCVLELAPPSLPSGYQVPFLSCGEEQVGAREERCRGNSSLSGEFVVEDVAVWEETLRRLIFLSRPFLTQTEARLKLVKNKNNKKRRKVVDKSSLASSYHGVMRGALGLYLNSSP